MAASLESYFQFLGQLGKQLEQLTKLAQEKAAAVRRDDLMAVNDCIRREQAMSLSLRNMDKKRETLLTELGLAGVPLSGLAEHCPPEQRLAAKRAAERLRNQYQGYQSAAQAARTILECNLHQIEKILAEQPSQDVGRLADIRA